MATQQAPDAGSGSGVPTCYRHAGRETYLSCTRCGRPACPECLRSAPVGQQCVECIKEGGRTVRQPTGVFGGRAVSGAVVTYTLVALNVAFYLVEWVYPKIVDYLALVGGAYDPNDPCGGRGRPGAVLPAADLGVPARAGPVRVRPAAHHLQHVGADTGRTGAGAPAGPAPVPGGIRAQRAGRLGAVLPARPGQRIRAGGLRCHLRAVRRLFRGGAGGCAWTPGRSCS